MVASSDPQVPIDLLVAVPVFNEEAALATVLTTWHATVSAQTSAFRILAIDDGSTDQTAEILDHLALTLRPHVEVIHQSNRGHGQTCLKAYREAVKRGIPWVLQIDSDGQCDPADFRAFWAQRDSWDVISGYRQNREDGWRRVLASRILQVVLLAVTGSWCPDANVPFRLMRTDALRKKTEVIPKDFDLANIALSVLIAKDNSIRQFHLPIRFQKRFGGEPSVPLSRFLKKAVELVSQLRRLPI